MEFFHPVDRIADQKVLDLILSVVEYFGTPVRMFPFAGVGVLVEGLPIEVRQPVGILWKVGGNPVQDDADALAVEIIDQVHKFLGRAVAGGGGKISRNLIAPGGVQGVLRDAHQLHMGVAHLLNVGGQLVGGLGVGVKSVLLRPVFLFPGTQMDFVDAHGIFDGIFPGPFFHPGAVAPGKAGKVGGNGGGAGPEFCQEGEGVCLKEHLAAGGGHGEFVQLSFLHARNKKFPDAGSGQGGHGVGFGIPAVKISGQMDCSGVGSPDGKIVALRSLPGPGVGTQLLENFIVGSGPEQVAVQLRNKAGFFRNLPDRSLSRSCIFFGVSGS